MFERVKEMMGLGASAEEIAAEKAKLEAAQAAGEQVAIAPPPVDYNPPLARFATLREAYDREYVERGGVL